MFWQRFSAAFKIVVKDLRAIESTLSDTSLMDTKAPQHSPERRSKPRVAPVTLLHSFTITLPAAAIGQPLPDPVETVVMGDGWSVRVIVIFEMPRE